MSPSPEQATSTSFVQQLKAASGPAWSAAVEHRFVTELFEGTIEDGRLATYLVQDYQFCDAFVALLGAATASAPDLTSRLPFARQLGFFAADENDYFTATFDELGVSEADRTDPDLWPVTRAFIALMREAAATRSYAGALAVLVVAELLYRDWATTGLPWPTAPKHRGWVEVHATPAFTTWVDWLVAELDAHVPADASERDLASEFFARAVALELAFFDSVYAD